MDELTDINARLQELELSSAQTDNGLGATSAECEVQSSVAHGDIDMADEGITRPTHPNQRSLELAERKMDRRRRRRQRKKMKMELGRRSSSVQPTQSLPSGTTHSGPGLAQPHEQTGTETLTRETRKPMPEKPSLTPGWETKSKANKRTLRRRLNRARRAEELRGKKANPRTLPCGFPRPLLELPEAEENMEISQIKERDLVNTELDDQPVRPFLNSAPSLVASRGFTTQIQGQDMADVDIVTRQIQDMDLDGGVFED